MMSAEHPLHSCRMKLGWAKRHLKVLEREVGLYLNSDPYPLRREADASGSKYLFRISVRYALPRERWSLLAGDCIHNARSSLDHAVCGIEAWSTGKPASEIRRSEYPICPNPEAFKAAQSKIGNLPPAAQALIEREQPFVRLKSPSSDPLAILQELDIRDKHRSLSLTTYFAMFRVVDSTGRMIDPPAGYEVFPGYFKDGAVVAALPIHDPDPKHGTGVFTKVEVVFDEPGVPGIFRDVTVVEILYRMVLRAASIINELDAYLGKEGFPPSKALEEMAWHTSPTEDKDRTRLPP